MLFQWKKHQICNVTQGILAMPIYDFSTANYMTACSFTLPETVHLVLYCKIHEMSC